MRKNNFITLLVIGIATIIGFFYHLDGVNATNTPESSMFVTPLTTKISLEAGEQYEGSIKVANSGTATEDLKYSLKIAPYSINKDDANNDDYGNFDVNTYTQYNSITDWITLDRESGTVQPNTTDVINYAINVPNDAPAGAQYASILVINENNEEDATGNIMIKNKMQIASAIFANVAGNTIEKGLIVENYIPSFNTTGELETTSMVRNEGNVYTDAEYTLQVWPLFSNEEICTNEENPDTSLVLPDTERYHTQSCNLPAVGIFKAKQIVRIFGEESIVEKTVIVCPIWLLFIIIFAIFALIFYFIAKARARKKTVKK